LIAADTSSVINFLTRQNTPDARLVEAAFRAETLRLPPPVVTELLSSPRAELGLRGVVDQAGMLPIRDDFWSAAGALRRSLLLRGLKARLADSLIAQCCIDADIPLITRDGDFRHFADHCGLKLAV
jgi:predicted nucleic acid-binding protein